MCWMNHKRRLIFLLIAVQQMDQKEVRLKICPTLYTKPEPNAPRNLLVLTLDVACFVGGSYYFCVQILLQKNKISREGTRESFRVKIS